MSAYGAFAQQSTQQSFVLYPAGQNFLAPETPAAGPPQEPSRAYPASNVAAYQAQGAGQSQNWHHHPQSAPWLHAPFTQQQATQQPHPQHAHPHPIGPVAPGLRGQGFAGPAAQTGAGSDVISAADEQLSRMLSQGFTRMSLRPPPLSVEALQALDEHRRPILTETGREALIIHAAQTEGSHYVCEMCGGVVACARKAQHDTYWCQPEGEAGDEVGDTALAQQPDSVGTYQAKDNSSNAEAAMAMSP